MTLPRAPPTPVTATTRPTAPTRQHPALAQRPRSNYSNPFVHPQFRSKAVCKLFCRHCDTLVCTRGMKAILLGDTRVELYSTDSPPEQVNLVEKDYLTRNCQCRIRDIACLRCGNVIGYHVTQPCEICLESCNNGHFWMFLADGVASRDRVATGDGSKSRNSFLHFCIYTTIHL
ncbi:FAM72 protein-domain-containing protein [Chytridium lagenaria]|nr:FAM72 protein-domain-containing protein [Chytridium lagenaria]